MSPIDFTSTRGRRMADAMSDTDEKRVEFDAASYYDAIRGVNERVPELYLQGHRTLRVSITWTQFPSGMTGITTTIEWD